MTLWQCKPGSIDLHAIYPELVRNPAPNTVIGEGTDGEVFLSDTSASTVLKRFFPTSTSSDRIHYEYWIGHSSTHPNIAQTHSLTHIDGLDGGYWQMELEYIPFALLDLLDYDVWAERHWTFDTATCLFAQIVDAVAHMHEHGITHRDLKVENIMVARDGTVKLIDFGSAAPSRNTLTGARLKSWANRIGTPITMAPETHSERFYDMEKTDVWSLAVIFIRLWLGMYPWEPELELGGLAEDDAFAAFLEERSDERACADHGDLDDRLLCQIPKPARDIVAGMLEVDAERRINISKVLGSEWLKQVARAT